MFGFKEILNKVATQSDRIKELEYEIIEVKKLLKYERKEIEGLKESIMDLRIYLAECVNKLIKHCVDEEIKCKKSTSKKSKSAPPCANTPKE